MSDQLRRRSGRVPVVIRHSAAALALAAGAVFLPACADKSKPAVKDTTSPVAADAPSAYSADALESLVTSLETKAHALPGHGTDLHRDAMRGVFDDLAQVLPILEGPEPSGAFRQQLITLESARDSLGGDVSGGFSAEPAIDTGLRAATAALGQVAKDESIGDKSVGEVLAKLAAKVDELDTVSTVGRPYVSADASVLMAQAVRQMSDNALGHGTEVAAADTAAPTTEPAAPAEAAPTESAPAEAAPAATDPAAAPAEEAATPTAPEAPTETPTAEPAPAETPGETPAPEPAAETPAVEAPAEDANK